MAIRALSISSFSRYIRDSTGWGGHYKMDLSILDKYKDDTFIVIFSPGTQGSLEEFERQKDKYKVLFRNKNKAINTVHGSQPRNTIIVFELKYKEEEEKRWVRKGKSE